MVDQGHHDVRQQGRTRRFTRDKSRAKWLDSTGKGQASLKEPAIYVAQSGSPWALQIYARALLKQPGMTMRALPGGTLKLEKGDSLERPGRRRPAPGHAL